MSIPNNNSDLFARRASEPLSLHAVNYSNFPTPDRSPIVRPPTPGGGPLNSHPATPEDLNYSFSSTDPEKEKENIPKPSPPTSTRDRTDSFRTPGTPASTYNQYHSSSVHPPTSSSPLQPSNLNASTSTASTSHRPSGVRKLLSISNLRSSFSSSRTSLSDASPDTHQISSPIVSGLKRPSSPSVLSLAPSTQNQHPTSDPRSISPHARVKAQPQLRKRGSMAWFKRKSSLLTLSGSWSAGDEGEDTDEAMADQPPPQPQQQDHGNKNPARPETRESKRARVGSPPPRLPEMAMLGGGGTSIQGDGDIGWDERMWERL